MTVRLTWVPKDGLKRLTKRLANRGPLVRNVQNLMLDMVNETHRHAGMPRWPESMRARREGGRTGYMTGRLQRGWHPDGSKPRIINRVTYAADFYYGHGHKMVTVPAHYRRTKSGMTTVRAHTKRKRPQPARPINWTRRYIRKAEEAILKHVLK
jgi:phage gpG-like protein